MSSVQRQQLGTCQEAPLARTHTHTACQHNTPTSAAATSHRSVQLPPVTRGGVPHRSYLAYHSRELLFLLFLSL